MKHAKIPPAHKAREVKGPKPPFAVVCPDLSIVICTHNRSSLTARLLKALTPQLKGHAAEILVIDSASHDDHRRALIDIVAQFADVRLIRVEEKGVSLARNTGVAHARAEWIGFIDDDEVPSEDWLDEAMTLIRRLPEDCAACGGVVIPAYELAPDMNRIGPRWRAFLGEIMAKGEFDQTERPQFGIGHSLVRVYALQQVGGFNRGLGRDGRSLLSGEEVLLLIQLEARGWRIWHSDRIRVWHDIEPDRLDRSWARRRSYWEGISTARIMTATQPGKLTRSAITAGIKSLPLMLTSPLSPARREIDLRLAFNIGMVTEALRRPATKAIRMISVPLSLAMPTCLSIGNGGLQGLAGI
ncbi:glycosyltransferase family 2 protein [Asticcacaulis machinosus]|uniref:Glycosyltransferase n=1 Tax=Asticcacaulis machinosus TaxID=2984211 RepID=A0ABT5HFU4_9CAUL|nr:glycosyltransferase [Asticcacaulis machinosus]